MFTRAFKGKGRSVIYVNGKDRLVKTGGDPAWRNNNPGNLKPGPHSRIHGSIGTDGVFAIFPSYEKGTEAQIWLLKKQINQNKTVFDMVDSYAPKNDKNDPDQYRKNLRQITGLNLDRKIKDLSEKEFKQLIAAIQRIEGAKPGTEERFRAKSIVDIQVNEKNVIVAYLIEDLGWKSQAETIDLIEKGRIDAVIVKEKGSTYIRTRPDGEISNNLEEKKPKKR